MNMPFRSYGAAGPSGINPNIRGKRIAVDLDWLKENGNRAQRRWAINEQARQTRQMPAREARHA